MVGSEGRVRALLSRLVLQVRLPDGHPLRTFPRIASVKCDTARAGGSNRRPSRGITRVPAPDHIEAPLGHRT
jgi:hypothetical protein